MPKQQLQPSSSKGTEPSYFVSHRQFIFRVVFLWKHNTLRHSFISYRVADIQNVAQVALEAGNSPQMIFRHYRELVRPAEAKTWFALAPGGKGKVVEMRKAA